jgi:aryl-alcohol dehydrogenase-like predicted oxidoreductase
MLDTAVAYGKSERVLGQAGVAGWKVITKIPSLAGAGTQAAARLEEIVGQSLSRLGLDRLHGVLLHDAHDLARPGAEALAQALDRLKRQGLTDNIGLSVYRPSDLALCSGLLEPDIVQAPLNLLDQRVLAGDWARDLAARGAELHVRSVFLQGLLLMRPSDRPGWFSRWAGPLERFDQMVAAHGGDPLEVCLGFVKAQTSISRIVVGVETPAQLSAVIRAYNRAGVVSATDLSCNDPNLIEPVNWELS